MIAATAMVLMAAPPITGNPDDPCYHRNCGNGTGWVSGRSRNTERPTWPFSSRGVLETTLKEKKKTDEALTKLAEACVNQEAEAEAV